MHAQVDESGGVAHAGTLPHGPALRKRRKTGQAIGAPKAAMQLFLAKRPNPGFPARKKQGPALLYAASRQRNTGQKTGKAAGFSSWISPFF
jgi:hypothetical protein